MRDPIPFLVESLRLEGWNAPKVVSGDFADDFCASLGSQFISRGKRALSILEDFGYLGKEPITEFVDGVDVAYRLADFLDRRTSVLYRFEVVRQLPFWISDLERIGM